MTIVIVVPQVPYHTIDCTF